MDTHLVLYHSKQIKYYTHGRGEPLMLVHGYQSDSKIWNPLVSLLEKQYYLIIPDLPGHGASQLVHPVNSMNLLGDILLRIAISERLEKFTLVGHSMGGYASLHFAEKNPNLLKQLFLINSHPFADHFTKVLNRSREANLIEDGRKEFLIKGFAKDNFAKETKIKRLDIVYWAMHLSLEQDEKGMLADLAGMMARNSKEHFLKKAKFPVGILLGKEDKILSELGIESLEDKRIKIHQLDNCGHMSMVERPDAIAEIIKKALPEKPKPSF